MAGRHARLHRGLLKFHLDYGYQIAHLPFVDSVMRLRSRRLPSYSAIEYNRMPTRVASAIRQNPANDNQLKTDWIRTKAPAIRYVPWLRTKTNWGRRGLQDYC